MTGVVRGVRRAVSLLSVAWLLFLLEPLSSPGLAFPCFALTFGVSLLVGAFSLALVLAQRPVSRPKLLACLLYPLAATRAALADKPPTTPTWMGLFRVRRIDVFPAEIRYLTDGCGVVDECGLVHVAGAVPAGRSKTRLKPLGAGWYHLYAVF